MGIVYRARDVVLGREVALKTPLPGSRREARHQKRFLREAKAASSLSHPGIVPVFEAFEEEGRPWLAMELVEGESLASRISRKGPLPAEEIAQYLAVLADALRTAHRQGVLHRDIKPSNILIAKDGTARLMDFGLATFLPGSDEVSTVSGGPPSRLTSDGFAVGTMGYMSPEQVLGRPLDERSDLFSLGTVVYEMCTGRRAFTPSSQGEVIDAILHRAPPRPSLVNLEIPEELDHIVRKCLAKRRDERYQSAAELLADVRVLQRREEPLAMTQTAAEILIPSRRWPRLVFPVAAAVLTVAAGMLWVHEKNAGGGLPPFVPHQITVRPEPEMDPAISPTGQEVAFSAGYDSGNTDIYIIDIHGGRPLRLTRDTAADTRPAWFPDGSTLAFTSERDGRPSIWKVPRFGGKPVLLVRDAGDPAISPDGRRIAFVRRGRGGFQRIGVASVHDPNGGRLITTEKDGLWDHREPAWSPDGEMICYRGHRDLWLIPAGGGRARRLTTSGRPALDPAWSPNGRFIYFVGMMESTGVLLRIPATGGEASRVTLGAGDEESPSLSNDGRRLAFAKASTNYAIRLVDLATGKEELFTLRCLVAEPSLAPDRSAMAFISRRSGMAQVWLVRLHDGAPSGDPVRLTDQDGSAAHPVFSPDGKWIAYFRATGERRSIWVVPVSGGVPMRFTEGDFKSLQPEWSPDGSNMAFVSNRGGSYQLWVAPVAEGRPGGTPRQLTNVQGSVMFPAWSPDGGSIAFIVQSGKGNDVFVAPVDGSSQPRRLTEGENVSTIVWSRSTGQILACGRFGGSRNTIEVVPRDGGSPLPLAGVPLPRQGVSYLDLDVSLDGGLLALWESSEMADIWVLETESGRF